MLGSKGAREVARGGAGPQLTYGGNIIGLPPKIAYRRRRVQAAAVRIRAAGSSLTAKLAIGGEQWRDADPSVLEVVPPFITILNTSWDQPRLRSEMVDAWGPRGRT